MREDPLFKAIREALLKHKFHADESSIYTIASDIHSSITPIIAAEKAIFIDSYSEWFAEESIKVIENHLKMIKEKE